MRGFVFVMVSLIGCGDAHQGSVDAAPPDATPYQRCGALPFDANRYHFIAPTTMATWSSSVAACYTFGMELASINDAAEYGYAPSPTTPYWLSTKYDDEGLESLDGCPPYFMWATGEPASMELEQCVYRGSDGMHTMACETPTMVIGALCETPRLSVACESMTSTYVASTDHARADADTSCQASGGHVVEINTSAELQSVLDGNPTVDNFWVAAKYNGSVFTGSTGCGQVFVWATGEPIQTAANMCVIYSRAGGMQMRACTDVASTICEKN